MKKRFTEEQITYALRQNEAGKPATEICREMGVSEQAFYRWLRFLREVGHESPASRPPFSCKPATVLLQVGHPCLRA